mgnify:FL=1
MGNLLTGSFPAGWRVPLREWTNSFVNWLVANYGDFFRGITDSLLFVLVQVERFLNWLPWWSVVILVGLLVWHASGKRVAPAALLAGLLVLVGAFGLWPQLVTTLAIMVVATSATVLIGIPIGIALARSDRLKRWVQPVLDAMQTMPSFVYLVPVVMFFGLGNVAAIFATFIYAAPPVIRLTDLGLRLVDEEVVEAADSFGASERQLLWWVRVPLAVPTIMAGINQTIMMALAMVVVASMIGARGLGQEVLRSLQRGDVGLGLEAGLAIVILAIIMDRVTAGYGKRMETGERAG